MKKKEIKKNDIQEMFEVYLKKDGLKMYKKLSSETYGGLFGSSSPATYDYRTAYSIDDLEKLMKEGFRLYEDIGVWLFNMIWTTLS